MYLPNKITVRKNGADEFECLQLSEIEKRLGYMRHSLSVTKTRCITIVSAKPDEWSKFIVDAWKAGFVPSVRSVGEMEMCCNKLDGYERFVCELANDYCPYEGPGWYGAWYGAKMPNGEVQTEWCECETDFAFFVICHADNGCTYFDVLGEGDEPDFSVSNLA